MNAKTARLIRHYAEVTGRSERWLRARYQQWPASARRHIKEEMRATLDAAKKGD